MEMMAMVKALVYAKKLCDDDAKLKNSQIILHSDSNLLVQSLNLGWKRKANLDLWEKLDAARADLNVKYVWVKAHAQNCHNNAVDLLAFSAAIKIKKS
jgi:ribonuclease HI